MARKTRQNINNEITINPNNTRNQLDLTSSIEHSNNRIYILLSVHDIFSKTDNMLGYKTSPKTFKGNEVIQTIFSNHNGIILQINRKKKIYVEIRNRPKP